MIIKAKIFQIIRWEEKHKYFFNTDFGSEPMDMLHLQVIDEDKPKWYHKSFVGMIRSFFITDKNLPYKYKNFIFNGRVTDEKAYPYYCGLPILVPLPNKFVVGDIIDLSVEANKK